MQYPVAAIIAGLLLLFMGRRLFWLFVALIGFAAGMILSSELFAVHDQLVLLAIGVVCGLIGAMLALFLQRLAIGVAGFLAGATVGVAVAQWLGLHAGTMIPGLIGGVIGGILLSAVFDWALIFLSSIAGASLIIRSINLQASYVIPAFVILALLGIVIQSRFVTGHRHVQASS
jgi:outer membrane lipoprotein SlyB